MKSRFVSMALAIFVALLASTAAQAAILTFYAQLEPEGGGGRTGSGSAVVSFDDVSHVLTYSGSFSGLSGVTTVAHFHCCTSAPFTGGAGVAVDAPTLTGIPVGVSAGSFSDSLDLDDANNFNPAFVTASGGTTDLAIARLIGGFYAHTAYLNIHSSTFTGGEIRGFIVSEPSSLALAALTLGAVGAVTRRRRSTTSA